MPNLAAGASVTINSGSTGGILNITQTQSTNAYAFPTLSNGGSNVSISLSYLPKSVTLAQNTTYTLLAGNVSLTYTVTN
jgi:hypothetical protein